ncbi:hypothetical protein DACRYDRAFT_20412 [Dacryopinax primogenitus]|uniref:Cytochrome oxidase assembly factor n=1 Tax=Dacryopinax primogenitus (strain DJM 731) TaxID=1858805 RepID=M5GG34_DACPD|nr:uncharacterized protein DACRYDRAFT_20412 [Dacryopinax primogenitus]EJU04793.1 hypothetical protein DACRYDRAFT_20412 [Dacryopinax primogenitus]
MSPSLLGTAAPICRAHLTSSPSPLRGVRHLRLRAPATPFFARSFPSRLPLFTPNGRALPISRARFASSHGYEDAYQSKLRQMQASKNRGLLFYTTAAIFVTLGISYAAVPLYRAFCSATGFGGAPMTNTRYTPDRLGHVDPNRRIKVHFNADTSDALPWTFTPQQKYVTLLPGETALAFYKAKNDGTEDIIGIATYNVTPSKIAPYFAKVECFCFEEQKLAAGEEVDMPLFFFIDKDFVDDPQMKDIDDVVLSYTFFKARRTNKGHLVPDAPLEVVEKASGFADYELAKQAHDDTKTAEATVA